MDETSKWRIKTDKYNTFAIEWHLLVLDVLLTRNISTTENYIWQFVQIYFTTTIYVKARAIYVFYQSDTYYMYIDTVTVLYSYTVGCSPIRTLLIRCKTTLLSPLITFFRGTVWKMRAFEKCVVLWIIKIQLFLSHEPL